MGWMFTHRPKGQSTIEFFSASFDGEAGRVLDAAAPSFTETYVAYELLDEQRRRRGVIAIVCLTRWRRHDYFNFGYKEMSEACGPCATGCPERILAQLTEYDFGSDKANRWARQWREACWDRVLTRKARPSLSRQDLIWFREPVLFASGEEHQVLQVRNPRRLIFSRPGLGGRRLKIRRCSLDGARVIASTDPRSKEARHAALDALIRRHGEREVGQAYGYVVEHLSIALHHRLDKTARAGERMAQLLDEVITAPSPQAWLKAEEARLRHP